MDTTDLKALEAVLQTLSVLEPVQQERVLRWAAEKLELIPSKRTSAAGQDKAPTDGFDLTQFETVADILAAAHAKTEHERALVTAAFLSKAGTGSELTAQQINNELKNCGHRIGDITSAIDILKDRKPQLVVQTKKSGTSRQARKKYKVTAAGFARVAELLSGAATGET